MEALIAGGEIAAGRGGEPRLSIHLHAGAEAIAIAAGAAKGDGEPMQRAAVIEEDLRMSAESGYDDILPAIVIEITEGRPSGGGWSRTSRLSALKTTIAIHRHERRFEIMKRGIDLLHVIQHVTLSDEQVFPTIVVEILQADTPA
jgi:hypothetical protein